MPRRLVWLALAVLAPLAGCVKKSTHEVALADLADARAEGEALREEVATVTAVKTRSTKRNPAPPFTTSTMQQEASRKLGYGPRRTMSVAQRLYEGIEHLSLAFGALADGGAGAPQAATAAADDATKSARRMEKVYRGAMSGLLELESEAVNDGAVIRELMGRRELYRRLSRIGDTLADVADRVWYASVKEM